MVLSVSTVVISTMFRKHQKMRASVHCAESIRLAAESFKV